MGAADGLIARLAAGQHGVVARRQLLAVGVSPDAIKHRLATERLFALHPGVYAAGHPALTEAARHMAAVLACGPSAHLSHGSAATRHRILTSSPGAVEVLSTGAHRDGPTGVKLRRTKHLPPDEVTTHQGIPITTPARTLLDLAAAGPPGRLELALNEALALRLTTREEIAALAATSRRGAPVPRSLLEDAPGYTRLEAERRLNQLILKAQLPRPRTNAQLRGTQIDAIWPEHRLIAEVDGYATHRSRRAFEQDRRRDAGHLALGYRTIRITWRQLTERPEEVVAHLAAALARRAA